MSFRRAAMRRDARNREKIQKCKAPGAELLKARNDGWEKGKLLATCICFETMYKDFGWRRKRLADLSNSLTEQSIHFTPDVLRFACAIWTEKLHGAIEKFGSLKLPEGDILSAAKYTECLETYVSTASYIMTAIHSEYCFSTNSSGTGRMDKLINRFALEYIKLASSIDYDIEGRADSISRLIGWKV